MRASEHASSSEPVCVVIPCYRADLPLYERASLARCVEVLQRHPLFLAKPGGLDSSALLQQYPTLRQEEFPDEFFRSVDGYNRLLLSDFFYARFARYEYMLIYQLDAFVFSDQLLSWCSRGYDYIGAPWLPRKEPLGLGGKLRARIRGPLYRWMDRKDRDGLGAHHAQYDYVAGNGGFSLRRVRKMRSVLAELSARAERYREGSHYTLNEDIFFCIEANRYRRRVKLPSLREAVQFAWESHPSLAARLNHGQLPFGCHGWNRLHRDEWRGIFARLGYSVDALLGPAYASTID